MNQAQAEFKNRLNDLIAKRIDVLAKHLNADEAEECNVVDNAILTLLQQDKRVSLTALLEHFTAKVTHHGWPMMYTRGELELRLTDLKKRHLTGLIYKSLETESKDQLQELAKFVETLAGLDANNFHVSNTNYVNRLISCLEMAVPFYVRGAPSSKFLMFLNNHNIWIDFEKLPEERMLDFLRALAEISSHTTAQVAKAMLPSTVKLLEKHMSATKRKTDETMSFAYVECLLYLLHHLADQAKDPDASIVLCKELRKKRLTCVVDITQARMKDLAKTLSINDIDVLDLQNDESKDPYLMQRKLLAKTRRQNTKTKIRTCNNILAMTKALQEKRPSFIGDDSVKLSWKEARKPLLKQKRHTYSCMKSPDRPDKQFKKLPKNFMEDLQEYGLCDLSDKDAESLVDSSIYKIIKQSNRQGPFALNDVNGIAMLTWQIKESELSSFIKEVLNKGISGKVRDQLYHLLCWAYVTGDLVSCVRCKQKWEDDLLPLCPWYLCAFCDPASLGKDERAVEPDRMGRLHHCYGHTIEGALRHIQTEGVPIEPVKEFICTDYQPPSADEPWMKRRNIISVRRIDSLKEALQELQKNKQPIGADLLHYSELFTVGKHIYYGPRTRKSNFSAYHAVIIEGVEKIDGEWVAVCKMSNGEIVADYGYVYVSLSTMYIPVGVSDGNKLKVRGSNEPMHLLTNFVIAEMDVKDIQKQDEEEEAVKGEDGDEKKKDKEPPEEKPEEEPEEEPDRIPLHKRIRLFGSGRPFFGRHRHNRSENQPEYDVDVAGITDPILHIRLLKLMSVLGQGGAGASDLMTYILAQVATKLESNNNAGNALELVSIRKGALELVSIRKGALELVSLLVNENNVKQLTKELMDYLEIRDEDFHEDLSAKICSIVKKFCPEKIWYIDQILKVLSQSAGKFVKDNVWHALTLAKSNASELYGYTTRDLYKAVLTYAEQETLVRVAIWCIGEYGDLLVNNVGMLGTEDPVTVTECDACGRCGGSHQNISGGRGSHRGRGGVQGSRCGGGWPWKRLLFIFS